MGLLFLIRIIGKPMIDESISHNALYSDNRPATIRDLGAIG